MDGYEATMMVQWLLRVLDFFSVTMVIPAMPQFLQSLGGTSPLYYRTLMWSTVVQVATTQIVGIVVDRAGDMRKLYILLCSLSVLGAGLYAAADAVEELRMPATVVVARLLTGAGASKATLVFMYLTRVARTDAYRNRWMVSLATARSVGLFAGPALTTVLVWLSGCSDRDPGGSVLGCYALPGTFLCGAHLAALLLLLSLWRPPLSQPPKAKRQWSNQSVPRSDMGSPLGTPSPGRARRDASLSRFFSKPHVIATCLVSVLPLAAGAVVEYAVPIVASRVMLWDTSEAGMVLMAISVAVLSNQLAIMRLQTWTDDKGRLMIDDCAIMLFGLAGLAVTFVLTSLLWLLAIGFGTTAPASSRSRWALVVGPIVLSEVWFPYLGNGVNMTFTRLVLTYVPARMGTCQALINSNGPILGQIVLTAWLGLTYSGDEVLEQGPPQVAWAGFGAMTAALTASVICCYGQLRPDEWDRVASTPVSFSRRTSFAECPWNPAAEVAGEAVCSLDAAEGEEPLLAAEAPE